MATPVMLIALLKVVAQGWNQHEIEENAQRISDLATEHYSRIDTFTESLDKMGKGLGKAVDEYNKAVGSFEHRILSTTRKLKALDASVGEDIDPLDALDKRVRTVERLEE